MQDPEQKRKRKYRSDGTPVWATRSIDGPGVWVSCVKGKEKQTIGELYDLFDSLANELWPLERQDDPHSGDDLSIEAQIAKEVAATKLPRHEQRFVNCLTHTPCVIFISCQFPVDPVKLVVKHMENVKRTGLTRTRYTHRMIPSAGTCVANIPEIQALCRKVLGSFFSEEPGRRHSYKIDLRVRNHNSIPRPTLIQEIARCVPEGNVVNLENPEMFILVEVFKSVCGVSIVKDYYQLHKFNVMELSHGTTKDKPVPLRGDRSGREEAKLGMMDSSFLGTR